MRETLDHDADFDGSAKGGVYAARQADDVADPQGGEKDQLVHRAVAGVGEQGARGLGHGLVVLGQVGHGDLAGHAVQAEADLVVHKKYRILYSPE